jgi:N6-L-threonylcarbamoyladenine synthase
MNILGIETSCDETSVAIVKNGKTVLSNVVTSSLKEHEKYGGIIPEIASRRQLEYIVATTQEALKKAKTSWDDIDKIAVTTSPGLIGSLLVGISFARSLSLSLKKPLIEVNHIHAHLYANFLRFKNDTSALPKLPAIGLIVSGGHTNIYLLKDFQHFKILGKTLDDAAGEAFDKVGRILNVGYPGGPIIDKLASQCKKTDIQFTCAPLPGTLDFSFSGIKTAVLYHTQKHKVDKQELKKISYSFQESVVNVLVKKSLAACHEHNVKTLLIGGGVAANSFLRKRLFEEAQKLNINVHFPHFDFCLDNAAMIAGLGYHLTQKEKKYNG